MRDVVVLCAVAGLSISLFLSSLRWRLVREQKLYGLALCGTSESSCRSVLTHPAAGLLGVPNVFLGIVYYILVLIFCILPGSHMLEGLAMVSSWLAVGAGIYLVYSLLVIIKKPCPLCMVCHVANIVIAVTITFVGP